MFAKIAFYGAADIYADGHQRDYNMFMRSTEGSKELVQAERDQVSDAFKEVFKTYYVVGFLKDPGFAEAGNNFERVLSDAVNKCRAKGVPAESTTTTQFFKCVYKAHQPERQPEEQPGTSVHVDPSLNKFFSSLEPH